MAAIPLPVEAPQAAPVAVDHLVVPVTDYARSKRFYATALRPLGFELLLDWPERRRAYLGLPGYPSVVWLAERAGAGSFELSLAAPTSAGVDAFHAAALAAGGRDVDPPGVRPQYTAGTYGARVVDPDGNVLEALYRPA